MMMMWMLMWSEWGWLDGLPLLMHLLRDRAPK